MKRKLACAAAAAFLLSATACGADDNGEQPVDPPAAEVVDEVDDFLSSDDEPDGMDCDAGDKAKKEIPDCGFYAGPGNKTFVWWNWVAAGRVTPPSGWDARSEVKQYFPAAPAATKAAKPGKAPKTARPTKRPSPSKSPARRG